MSPLGVPFKPVPFGFLGLFSCLLSRWNASGQGDNPRAYAKPRFGICPVPVGIPPVSPYHGGLARPSLVLAPKIRYIETHARTVPYTVTLTLTNKILTGPGPPISKTARFPPFFGPFWSCWANSIRPDIIAWVSGHAPTPRLCMTEPSCFTDTARADPALVYACQLI